MVDRIETRSNGVDYERRHTTPEPREMQLSVEDERMLIDMLGAYRAARKAGKYMAWAAVGLLGFMVLLNQAWEATRSFAARLIVH